MEREVVIIGAGIAGLSCALALQKRGISARIFESSSALSPVGSGIWLGINAMQVFGRLGIAEQLIGNGQVLNQLQLYGERGQLLQRFDLQALQKKLGQPQLCLYRHRLQDVLLQALPDVPIHLDHDLSNLSFREGQVQLTFTDGSEHQASTVIGADGIHSSARKVLFPRSSILPMTRGCYRGVSDFVLPVPYSNKGIEFWHQGALFGCAPIEPGKTFWWAISAAGVARVEDEFLGDLFSGFPAVIQQLLSAKREGPVHYTVLSDLPLLPKWYHKQVCLIGDAAHAMQPNLGQGGSMAIESAFILADVLAKEPEQRTAFAKFQKKAKRKTHRVKVLAGILSYISGVRGNALVTIRDFLVRVSPSCLGQWTLHYIFRID